MLLCSNKTCIKNGKRIRYDFPDAQQERDGTEMQGSQPRALPVTLGAQGFVPSPPGTSKAAPSSWVSHSMPDSASSEKGFCFLTTFHPNFGSLG